METNEYIYLFTSTPCSEARKWLQSQSSLEDAWKNCHRGDWMWWALSNGNGTLPEKSLSVKYAKWCADRARTHSSAAAYAAYAADADAAAAAAADADADAAADAAAAAADAYAAAAYAADERKLQANWIRKHVLYPFGNK